MRFFSVFGILFYATVIVLIGVGLILFAVNLVPPKDIGAWLTYVNESFNSRVIVGLSGVLLIIISSSLAQLMLGRLQRERTIAFKTASGEVTIALSAVEDIIKRVAAGMPEIRELRPDVIATKKGIEVDVRVILRSETNIPYLTARLQDIIKSRIQEVIGVEEQILIRIHILKIISIEDKDRRKKDSGRDADSSSVLPFGGYRP